MITILNYIYCNIILHTCIQKKNFAHNIQIPVHVDKKSKKPGSRPVLYSTNKLYLVY